jgi:cell division protein FtsB
MRTESPQVSRALLADAEDSARGDGGKGLVFWILIALAVATLAPCFILPAWRDYQRAELAARVRDWQVQEATERVQALERRLEAINNDPATVARLARRTLEFHQDSETTFDVPVMLAASRPTGAPREVVPIEPAKPQWQPQPLPVGVARLVALLPRWNYDALFCASPTRETLLALSLGLFVAAFAIFWPKPAARDESAG